MLSEKVFVIPNAVDTTMFRPAPGLLKMDPVVIVVISRLVYQKSMDLLVEVIPEVLFSRASKKTYVKVLQDHRKVKLKEKSYSLLPLILLLIEKTYVKVHFIIGGDGPKRLRLEEKNTLFKIELIC